MNTELSILRQENMEMIISHAPATYTENMVSHDRCLEAGGSILAEIKAHGMTDELDQKAALFIEKARKTVRKMNDKRSSLTKLFDDVRSRFTAMENEIDPGKSGSLPALVQAERNNYAAKKYAEEQARQQELLRQQRIVQAKTEYRTACDADYRKSFHDILNFYLDGLRTYFEETSLETYDDSLLNIKRAPVTFPSDYSQMVRSRAALPLASYLSSDEIEQIQKDSLNALLDGFREEFNVTMQQEQQRLIDLMPSKRQQLELAAKASEEEAARIRQQIKEKEEAERQRVEAERQEREQKERMEREMKAKQAEMENLFDQASVTTPAYQPKSSVKKRIVPLDIEAFPEIFTLWWTKEGCHLSLDELCKVFKKQITFAEKCAKEGEFINSQHLSYTDNVKAK